MTYNKKSLRVTALSLGILSNNTCIILLLDYSYSITRAKTCDIKQIDLQRVKGNCTIKASGCRGDLACSEGDKGGNCSENVS
jgi:hypothetical protein